MIAKEIKYKEYGWKTKCKYRKTSDLKEKDSKLLNKNNNGGKC